MSFVPGLVRYAGSMERLLFVGVLFSLQIDVCLTYQFRPYKPAGPSGILISPILVAAALFAL